MPHMPNLPANRPIAATPEEPTEELTAILLDKLANFNMSIRNLYKGSQPNQPVFDELIDLHERYFAAGGTAQELATALRGRSERDKQELRRRVTVMIENGKFPPLPPCPQYFKDDRGCNWENEWFDYDIELVFKKRKQGPLRE